MLEISSQVQKLSSKRWEDFHGHIVDSEVRTCEYSVGGAIILSVFSPISKGKCKPRAGTRSLNRRKTMLTKPVYCQCS